MSVRMILFSLVIVATLAGPSQAGAPMPGQELTDRELLEEVTAEAERLAEMLDRIRLQCADAGLDCRDAGVPAQPPEG